MSEQEISEFEMRSRALFQDSVDGSGYAHPLAADAGAQAPRSTAAAQHRPRWLFSWKMWTPAAGVTAAAILGLVYGSVRR